MSPRPVWRRKRVLIPLGSLLVLLVGVAVAVARSNPSTLVVYNHTSTLIPLLRITACGRTATHRSLVSDASWEWRPETAQSASEIELELATEPPVLWKGGHFDPHGGQRVTLHVWPGGEVEFHTQVSIWQRWMGGLPDVQE